LLVRPRLATDKIGFVAIPKYTNTVDDKPLSEGHQGVMTDRRHSLKRGDRLSKKERQTTASNWKKATNCNLCYGSKVTATFITIKQATKQLQNE
jgi:hypothetical protein